jgi:8-oxo-dGTP diphosphatase
MNTTRFATKAVIFKDDKVLVLVRASKDGFRPGEDDFPGGKIEFGEEPNHGMLREIKEEAGLDVKIVGPVRCWSFVAKKENWQLFGVSYLCEWKKEKVRLSEEHDSFSWKTPQEILKSKCRKWMKDDLRAALKLRKKKK